MMEAIACSIELRDAEGGPRLHGTILAEGRAARGGRAELFAPGSVTWPPSGIGIKARHGAAVEVHAVPRRAAGGEITIEARATPAIVAAVKMGSTSMSVEFTRSARPAPRPESAKSSLRWSTPPR